MTFHDLRYTYASVLLKRGESAKYVSEQLGHSDVETTLRLYCHLVPNAHRGGINALARETGRHGAATDGNELEGQRQENEQVVVLTGAGEGNRTSNRRFTNSLPPPTELTQEDLSRGEGTV